MCWEPQGAEFVMREFKFHAPSCAALLVLDVVREDGQVSGSTTFAAVIVKKCKMPCL